MAVKIVRLVFPAIFGILTGLFIGRLIHAVGKGDLPLYLVIIFGVVSIVSALIMIKLLDLLILRTKGER